jgi:hypothetical protein
MAKTKASSSRWLIDASSPCLPRWSVGERDRWTRHGSECVRLCFRSAGSHPSFCAGQVQRRIGRFVALIEGSVEEGSVSAPFALRVRQCRPGRGEDVLPGIGTTVAKPDTARGDAHLRSDFQ